MFVVPYFVLTTSNFFS